MNSNLIVTRADKGFSEMTELTFPLIKRYAQKCGAEFMVLDHDVPDDLLKNQLHPWGHKHYRILQCQTLLKKYARILVLDCDILITKYCPSLFDVVPYDMIGSIYEDVGSRREHRRKLILDAQLKFGPIGWLRGYINTGVFIVSNIHKPIFDPINGEYWEKFGEDDVHIGYNIVKNGFKVFELSYDYNHMSLFSEGWFNSPSRFNSLIIHHAGEGNFPERPQFSSRLELMKHDYETHKDLWI